jgi:anti-anti-sigma regulatory factor
VPIEHARRLEAYLEQLYLMTTTFSALTLQAKPEIADTLLSLTCSFMERATGTLLLQEDRGLVPVAIRGDLDTPDVVAAAPLWASLAEDRFTQIVPPSRLPASLRASPSFLGGLVSTALTLQDHAIGLVAIGAGASEGPFVDADLSFLTAAAGIGALSLASTDAIAAQQRLTREMEWTAEEARGEATEKARLLEELDQKLEIINRQHEEIIRLSTPILEVWPGVLLLPIIGSVDSHRGSEIMSRLLAEIVAKRATDVIVDMTGVEIVDTSVADHFIKLVGAMKLLGTRGIITGIQPAVAQAMVGLGVDLVTIVTLRNLEQGLRLCMRSRTTRGADPRPRR